ncbi:copper chaperone CopZ [Salisediminibacterium halotolerans]|uniref:Copper chaperone CopZ n=1 Tax=Salisediminibacterium halotolerans TaxID=517425 RepID=A0A1H9W5J5_9BACI|nr:copper chaperone CopZ [Salisediminibacterium haloalkalitolerans]SES29192.1 copper chaperone [Salisediminibacterium haloalkalitolerans]
MSEETIEVQGMTCKHCKASVEGALSGLDGVNKAEVNLDKNQVTVDFDDDKVTVQKMKDEIEDIGFEPK